MALGERPPIWALTGCAPAFGWRRARARHRQAVARAGAVFEQAREGRGVVGGHGPREGRCARSRSARRSRRSRSARERVPTSARPAPSTATHAPRAGTTRRRGRSPTAPATVPSPGAAETSWSEASASPRAPTATHSPLAVQDARGEGARQGHGGGAPGGGGFGGVGAGEGLAGFVHRQTAPARRRTSRRSSAARGRSA